MAVSISHKETPGSRVFDPGDTMVTEDNIEASKVRYQAMQAIKSGTATLEQKKLLADLDAAIQRGR